MTNYNNRQAPFSPPMYPESVDNIRPVPPLRSEFAHSPQEQPLLPPVPERMDIPSQKDATLTRQVIEEVINGVFQRVNLDLSFESFLFYKYIPLL
jgi:hypothetical protein